MEGTIGEVRMFAGTFAPLYWAFCDGSLMSIPENDALYSVIGTTYGGDGMQTFAVPDLRGRLPVGTGQGAGLQNIQLGQVLGTESTTLTANTMPQHVHIAFASSDGPGQNIASGGLLATNNRSTDPPMPNIYTAPDNLVNMQPTSAVGANEPFSIMQSVACTNYVICTIGIYPSRN